MMRWGQTDRHNKALIILHLRAKQLFSKAISISSLRELVVASLTKRAAGNTDLGHEPSVSETTAANLSRTLSPAARKVLAALLERQGLWCHGYYLSNITGVKSGTLYPLLGRLEKLGHLEAEWQTASNGSAPPRHAYRLTQRGLKLAEQHTDIR